MTQKTSLKDRCFTDILFFEASQLVVLIAAKIVDAVLLKRFGIQSQLCTSGAASVAAELAAIAFLLLRLNREDKVLLHIFSNVVLGYGLPRLLEGLPGAWATGVYITICLAAAFISVRWLAPRKDGIRAALRVCVIWKRWEGMIRNPVFLVLTVWNGVVIASNFMAV